MRQTTQMFCTSSTDLWRGACDRAGPARHLSDCVPTAKVGCLGGCGADRRFYCDSWVGPSRDGPCENTFPLSQTHHCRGNRRGISVQPESNVRILHVALPGDCLPGQHTLARSPTCAAHGCHPTRSCETRKSAIWRGSLERTTASTRGKFAGGFSDNKLVPLSMWSLTPAVASWLRSLPPTTS